MYDGTFQGIPAVYPVDAANNKKFIFAITADGRLIQVWDTAGRWQHGFPAELAPGWDKNKRFQSGVAVYPTHATENKSIYAITTDGELVHLYDTDIWHFSFPLRWIQNAPRFQGMPAVFPDTPSSTSASVYAVSTDNKLVHARLGNNGWVFEYLVENAGVRFQGSPAAFLRPDGKICIYVLTTDGRLVQVWNDPRWVFDFPAEQV